MVDLGALLAGVEGFDWDAGNTAKNVLGHGVSQAEAEEMFKEATEAYEIFSNPELRQRYDQFGWDAFERGGGRGNGFGGEGHIDLEEAMRAFASAFGGGGGGFGGGSFFESLFGGMGGSQQPGQQHSSPSPSPRAQPDAGSDGSMGD